MRQKREICVTVSIAIFCRYFFHWRIDSYRARMLLRFYPPELTQGHTLCRSVRSLFLMINEKNWAPPSPKSLYAGSSIRSED